MNNRERIWREIALAGLAFVFFLGAVSIILAQVDYSGTRRLETPESTLVVNAINRIANGMPDSISAYDADSNLVTVNCDSIAKTLRDQLRSGRVRVDTNMSGFRACADHDGTPDPSQDALFFSKEFMDSLRRGLIDPVHLVEMGVHERAHKMETDRDPQDFPWDGIRNEILALALEAAAKSALHVNPQDPDYTFCIAELAHMRDQERDGNPRQVQPIRPQSAGGRTVFLLRNAVTDTFVSFLSGTLGWYVHPLTGMSVSDMIVFEDEPPIPPGEQRVVLCGGIPHGYRSRVRAMGMYSDGTLRELPDVELDFGPPLYPPMFFGAMAYASARNMFFVLDTVQRRILNMMDTNGDLVPDVIVGDYAHPAWPGFLPLEEATGLDAAIHRTLGFGLIVQRGDLHVPHVRQFAQNWLFLPDANGDNMAESCFEVPAYQFLDLLPAIEDEVIWAGQMSIPVFGNWQHDVLLWSSDSLGNARFDLLGIVHMNDIHLTCELTRPLLDGEYVLPVDEPRGTSPSRATPVIAITPRELTLSVVEGNLLQLRWQPVADAASYRVYASEDCMTFIDTGLRTESTTIVFPPPPIGTTHLCYRVTAEK